MHLDSDKFAAIFTSSIARCKQTGKPVRAEIAVLVRHIQQSKRLPSSLVGVLPVEEDGDFGRSARSH